MLSLRIIASFLKANPETPAIRYLYKITNVLVFPFQDIFPNINLKKIGVNAPLDTVALASLIGYLIIFFIIIGALRILTKD